MNNVDITKWKQKGEDLKLEIYNAVAATQSLVIQPLPSEITMTKEQFKMLAHDPDMLPMQGTTDRIWTTPLNVMEIIVK